MYLRSSAPASVEVASVTGGTPSVIVTKSAHNLVPGDIVIIGPYKVLESLTNDQKVKDEKATTQPATKKS